MKCHLRNSKSADASPAKLKWLWAVGEQIRLHNLHDARWLHHARNRWPSRTKVDEFTKLLHTYRVDRNIPRELRPEILQRWRRRFAAIEPRADMAYLTREWISAVEEGKRICDRYCYSAASKFMWFFYPHRMTMFDKYARTALKDHVGRPVGPDNFLEAFESYFADNRKAIRAALDAFSVRYPYERRIADKHLWLCGSDLTDSQIRANVLSWR